ncbi:MAG: AAA family ATPase [Sandaracinaceae bacterium]
MPSPARPRLSLLFGRDDTLRQLTSARAEGARLITLTGLPGIGKTRLAQEVLTKPDTALVDLAGADDADEVAARVAGALDLRLSWLGTSSYEEELGYALEGRGAVTLVLDEADGSIDLLGALLRRWLELAPELTAVVTSRVRVGVDFEQIIEVGPLHLGDDPLSGPAGALLLARAGLERPTNPDVWNRLLHALDGIPLAIELAAARLAVLRPEELLRRLIDATTDRDALQDGLAHAVSALGPEAARAFAGCAVFPSSFDAATAEDVLGEGALEALGELRHRSLITQTSSGRLRLYAPVRAFAQEQARTLGLWDEFAAGHASTMARLARAAEADLDPYERLAAEVEGLRAAFQRSAEGPERDAVGLALGRVLSVRGPQKEAVSVFDALLNATDRTVAARAHLGRGRALVFAGRVADAVQSFGAVEGGALDVPGLEVEVSTALSDAELARGHVDIARAHAEDAVDRVDASTPAPVAVDALRAKGRVAHAGGRLEDARDAFESGRRLARTHDLPSHAARLMADLGAVRLAQRRLDEAEELYREALTVLDARLDPVAVGLAEGNLAILQQELGRFDEAAEHYQRGIDRLRRVGHRHFRAHLAGYAGALEHERGELHAAVARYGEATDVLATVGDARLGALVSSLAGAAEAARDRIGAAEEAFSMAQEQLERVDDDGVRDAVELSRGHLDLARGRRDGALDDARRRAFLRLDAVSAPSLERSDDARLAHRLLSAALGRGALTLNEDEKTLTLPDGETIALGTRDVIWRLVSALVHHRRDAPGESVSPDALIDAGWPGERMSPQSAAKRLKVGLSTLRKLGLRPLLQRHDGGYRFDPEVPLNVA